MFGRLGRVAKVPINCNTSVHCRCEGLDEGHAHFHSFAMSLLTLFRISTGDNGSGILADLMREEPYCDASSSCERDCCANAWIAPVFFVVFTVCTQYVILSIMVALLMSRLNEATSIFDRISQLEQDADYRKKVMQGLDRGEGKNSSQSDGPSSTGGQLR